jgi:cytochrome c oxidase assembly factor CtaG
LPTLRDRGHLDAAADWGELTVPESLGELVVKSCVLAVLVVLASVYTRGWRVLRRRGHGTITRAWRLVVYLAGLGVIGLALLSIDELADAWFSAHMIQHLLLTMVAAPLLLLGNPLPPCLWGVPPRARHALGHPLTRQARFRRMLAALTRLPVAWLIYVGFLWVWHLPLLYGAALEHEAVHILEHLTFFASSLIFWWPIVRPAPRLHPRLHPGFEILYLVAATAQNTALGAFLSLQERVVYRHYARSTPGIEAISDQTLAGGIMWINGHMYLLPILLLLWSFAQETDSPSPGVSPTAGPNPKAS